MKSTILSNMINNVRAASFLVSAKYHSSGGFKQNKLLAFSPRTTSVENEIYAIACICMQTYDAKCPI